MEIDKLHYVHSQGGAFGPDTDTSAQDIAAAVDAALAHKDGHLILHFHGGLVSKKAGLKLAGDLLDTYQVAGHPLFFIGNRACSRRCATTSPNWPTSPWSGSCCAR